MPTSITTLPKITALFETSLSSALSAAGSSFTVVSGSDRDGNALSGTYGFVIDEGTADEEFVIGSISGTTVTISARGLDGDDPTTEVSGNKKAHRRGATVKITDYPILAFLRNMLNGDFSIPNKLSYTSAPTFVYGNKELVTWDKAKDYADSLANTGAADASTTVQGLVEEPTQAEVEAGTDTGGTGAKLFVPVSKHGGKLYFGYAADAGANDTYAITCSPVPTAYTTGMVIHFKANTANTGACTVNVNTLGAKSLKVNKDLDPQDGYIKAGQIVEAIYDGTNFQILSVSGKPSVSQSGEEIYSASSGGSDTYAITLVPAPTAYTTGMVVRFKADVANTGAATLNVNSLGAKTIKKNVSEDIVTGDILANQVVEVVYDGTNFQITNLNDSGAVSRRRVAQFLAGGNDSYAVIGPQDTLTLGTSSQSAFEVTLGDAGDTGTARTSAAFADLTKNFVLQDSVKWSGTYDGSGNSSFFGIKESASINRGSDVPNDSGAMTIDHAGFIVDASGALYASVADGSTQTKSSALSGVTIANYNVYRIERVGSDFLFFVNDTLKATLSTNLPNTTTNYIFWYSEIAGSGATPDGYFKKLWAYVVSHT